MTTHSHRCLGSGLRSRDTTLNRWTEGILERKTGSPIASGLEDMTNLGAMKSTINKIFIYNQQKFSYTINIFVTFFNSWILWTNGNSFMHVWIPIWSCNEYICWLYMKILLIIYDNIHNHAIMKNFMTPRLILDGCILMCVAGCHQAQMQLQPAHHLLAEQHGQ